MKSLRLVLGLVLVFQLTVAIGQNPVSVLVAGDVDKFIKSAEPMNREFEALGYDTSGESDALMTAMQSDAKVIAIIKKYGWEPGTISIKWMSIGMCYAKLKMDEQMAMLPAEQREMMKQMMKETGQNYDVLVNPQDLAMVKAKVSQLDMLMMSGE